MVTQDRNSRQQCVATWEPASGHENALMVAGTYVFAAANRERASSADCCRTRVTLKGEVARQQLAMLIKDIMAAICVSALLDA
jgi:hypothetical protein